MTIRAGKVKNIHLNGIHHQPTNSHQSTLWCFFFSCVCVTICTFTFELPHFGQYILKSPFYHFLNDITGCAEITPTIAVADRMQVSYMDLVLRPCSAKISDLAKIFDPFFYYIVASCLYRPHNIAQRVRGNMGIIIAQKAASGSGYPDLSGIF